MGGAAGLPTGTATATDGQTSPFANAPAPDSTMTTPDLSSQSYRPAVTTLQGFEGYQNPFRAATGTSANTSPYLSVPGSEGVRNPFYSPYQQQQTAFPRATDLDAQYQAYTQGYAKNVQAAKDQRIADARAAQQAYQTARGSEALKAEYEQKLADQQAQFEQQQQQQQPYYNYVDIGASGGIASLQKGFKR